MGSYLDDYQADVKKRLAEREGWMPDSEYYETRTVAYQRLTAVADKREKLIRNIAVNTKPRKVIKLRKTRKSRSVNPENNDGTERQ